MKNKGFTLIELLAVIVILAIIALIATPIIIGIIDNTREEANKRSVDLYANSLKNSVVKYEMVSGKSLSGNFTTTDGKTIKKVGDNIELEVEYSGQNVVCSTIMITVSGNINLDGCKVGNNNKEYTYEPGKKCLLTNDVNGNKEVDLGDEVTCGTEIFYVLPNDSNAHPTAIGNNITLITKYNLDVGNISDLNGLKPISNPTGIQSSKAIGWIENGQQYYGVVAFSQTWYWGQVPDQTFVYNNQSLLYPYVENYKTHMINMGVAVKEASLASSQQFYESATLMEQQGLYLNFNFTSFWLGSASPPLAADMFFVNSNGGIESATGTTRVSRLGVRPVIIIPKTNIKVL